MEKMLCLRDAPAWKDALAQWFHEKWSVPLEAYQQSMEDSLREGTIVPSWYFCANGARIVGGCGVIENDFHDRKDLSPNVCAVYVEEAWRCRGIAGRLLALVCADMQSHGISTLYLLTDHTGFYERYGWEFLCMAQADGEETPSRVYIHRQS